VPRGLAE
jgi:predicted RecB family nuclease